VYRYVPCTLYSFRYRPFSWNMYWTPPGGGGDFTQRINPDLNCFFCTYFVPVPGLYCMKDNIVQHLDDGRYSLERALIKNSPGARISWPGLCFSPTPHHLMYRYIYVQCAQGGKIDQIRIHRCELDDRERKRDGFLQRYIESLTLVKSCKGCELDDSEKERLHFQLQSEVKISC
jgi:hypothetical protein